MDEQKPGPVLMSVRKYAEHRGFRNGASVSRAIKDGRLVKSITRDEWGNPKINDVLLADQEWEANTQHDRAPAATRAATAALGRANAPLIAARARPLETSARLRPTPPPSPGALPPNADPDDERYDELGAIARLKHWQAETAELKYREAAKELIPVAKLHRAIDDVFAACRTRILAIPSRCRQSDPTLTPAQIAAIESLTREALEALVVLPETFDQGNE